MFKPYRLWEGYEGPFPTPTKRKFAWWPTKIRGFDGRLGEVFLGFYYENHPDKWTMARWLLGSSQILYLRGGEVFHPEEASSVRSKLILI